MENYVKMGIDEESCKSFGNRRKVMKLWIVTLQFQLKKKNKQRKVAKSEEKNELDVGKTLIKL